MSDVKPFVLDFDLVSGFCTSGKVKPTQRRVSDMAAQFANEAAARAMVEGGDPLLYEFYGLDLPETTPACSSSAPPSSTPERWGRSIS